MEKRYEKKVPVCLTIHVRETESGAIKGDDGSTSYPYNYTVSMQFRGKIINSKSLFQTVAKLPDALRKMVMREGSMNLKDECTLIAELEPDEKSMKVEQWKCSDPVNNTPPPLCWVPTLRNLTFRPEYGRSVEKSTSVMDFSRESYPISLHGKIPGVQTVRNRQEPGLMVLLVKWVNILKCLMRNSLTAKPLP